MNARKKAKKYKNELDRLSKLCLPNKLAPAYVYQRIISVYKSRRIIDPVDRTHMTPRDFVWIKRRMVEDLAEKLINDGCVKFDQVNNESGTIELECTLRIVKI